MADYEDRDDREHRRGGGVFALIVGILLITLLIFGFWWLRGGFGFGGIGGAVDTVPPNAPSNIVGDSRVIFDVPLSWQDNSDNEDGFRIYRLEIGSGQPLQFAGGTGANQPAFLDQNVACGATYQYTVSSFNEAGESPATECWEITLPPCPDIRDALMSSGTQGGLNFLTGAVGGSSDFYWNFGNDGSPIFLADQAGQNGLVDLGDTGGTPLVAINLPAGASYANSLPAVQGHTYAALARDGLSLILFRLNSAADPMNLAYIVVTPEAAITSSCSTLAVSVPPGLSFTGGGTSGGSTGSTTGGDTGTTTGGPGGPGGPGGTGPSGPPGPCVADPADGECCEEAGENPSNDPACGGGTGPSGPPGGCGAPCEDSSTCGEHNGVPLSCFAGACWDACACGQDCGTDDGGDTGGTTGGQPSGPPGTCPNCPPTGGSGP